MARLQRDTVTYFPHYASASDSDTLTILQSQFGNDGYAFWFKLLEKLASSEGHFIDCSNNIKWQLLLAKTGVNDITGVEIMKLLVEMQAIDKDLWASKVIWCQKLVNNITDVYKNRRREIPLKPLTTEVNALTTADNGITTDNRRSKAIPVQKVKESKRKKSKEYITLKTSYGEFENVLLTDKEYQKLKDKFYHRTDEVIQELSAGIESKGYKYKSHYAAILNWQRRESGKDRSDNRKTNRALPSKYTESPSYEN